MVLCSDFLLAPRGDFQLRRTKGVVMLTPLDGEFRVIYPRDFQITVFARRGRSLRVDTSLPILINM